MQVVILAGGLGTRLRPITERVPKPMVEIAGRPFLEFIVRHVAEQGFERLLLLLGYLGEQIEDYFGDGDRFGVKIDYATEPLPLGTAGALRNALEKLEPEFLLLYGDSYLPIDYRKVAQVFHEHPSRGLIVVYDNRLSNTGVQNNVAIDANHKVLRYQKGRFAPDLQYVEAGVLCFRRELFAQLPAGLPVSLEQELYPKLIATRKLRAFVTQQRFFDIGTPDRLEEFMATLS